MGPADLSLVDDGAFIDGQHEFATVRSRQSRPEVMSLGQQAQVCLRKKGHRLPALACRTSLRRGPPGGKALGYRSTTAAGPPAAHLTSASRAVRL